MRVRLAKWGNSLGLRVPNALARQLGFEAGREVEVRCADGALVVEAVAPAYRLADLLSGMSPKAMRAAFDWGDEGGDG
jgi:antitoxin MazE